MDGILWVTSYPKSGNTWFRVFATSLRPAQVDHPLINAVGSAVPSASGRYIFDELTGVNTTDLTQAELDRLRPEAFREYLRLVGRTAMLKLHDAYQLNDRGECTIPADVTAGVLYLVRNPLDVAVSYAHHSGCSVDKSIAWMNDPGHTIGGRGHVTISQPLGRWSDHVTGWAGAEEFNRMIVRYEDMVADPVTVFTDMAKFAGLRHDQAGIQRALELSSFDRLQQRESEVGFHEKNPRAASFFRKGEVGSYRESLSAAQQRRIVDDHGPVMSEMGYLDASGEPVF